MEVAGKENGKMDDATGLREKAMSSRPSEGRTEVEYLPAFQARRTSWRRVKRAPILCKTPSCNNCSKNFCEGKFPPCH